jgi:hypothetical protein
MTDLTINRYVASGTQAQRLAFTPAPATPASGPSPLCIWYETDTGYTYLSANAAAWVRVNDGLPWKPNCRAATTGALAANTYANGTSGVGATLTGNANGALAAQDGVTLVANDRLLVKNEVAGENNGIYVVTQVGAGGTPYILTRATDADSGAELVNAVVKVSEGTTLADTEYQCTTNATITVGTTALTWSQPAAGGGLLAANNLSDVASATTSRTNLGVGTGDSPQFTAVNIGNASDTTVTRTGAGDIAVEGNALYRAGGTDVPVADGGTGASTAAGARSNLAVNKILIGFEIDGGGSTITTGFKGYGPRVSVAHTITKATALSVDSAGPATSCSITIDVWADTYANFPPTSGDKISASAPVSLSSATKSEDSTLTGWTTSIAADSIYGFSVASVTGAKKVLILMEATF